MHETMTDVEVMELLGLDETSFAHVIRIGDLVPVREHPRVFDSQAVREYQTEINRESAAFHDLMTIQKELGYTSTPANSWSEGAGTSNVAVRRVLSPWERRRRWIVAGIAKW